MNMIEKVARALYLHSNPILSKTIEMDCIWIERAKVAIEAMKEPTEEMILASSGCIEYRAMIEAALKQ